MHSWVKNRTVQTESDIIVRTRLYRERFAMGREIRKCIVKNRAVPSHELIVIECVAVFNSRKSVHRNTRDV